MKHYVVGLAFDDDENVLLIEKNRPEFQKGRLNGIGGSIEIGETPVMAIVREMEEEAGLQTEPESWTRVAVLQCRHAVIHFLACFDTDIEKAISKTDEQVTVRPVTALPPNVMDNLRIIIPLCYHPDVMWPVLFFDKEYDDDVKFYT